MQTKEERKLAEAQTKWSSNFVICGREEESAWDAFEAGWEAKKRATESSGKEKTTLINEVSFIQTGEDAAEKWLDENGYASIDGDSSCRRVSAKQAFEAGFRAVTESKEASDALMSQYDQCREDCEARAREGLSPEQRAVIDVCAAYSRLCGEIEVITHSARNSCWEGEIGGLVSDRRTEALQTIRNYGDTRLASFVEDAKARFELLVFARPESKLDARRALELLGVLPRSTVKKQNGN